GTISAAAACRGDRGRFGGPREHLGRPAGTGRLPRECATGHHQAPGEVAGEPQRSRRERGAAAMKAVLQDILDRIPEALGAAVVGLDGIPVEKLAARQSFNIDLASAEWISLAKRAAAALRSATP